MTPRKPDPEGLGRYRGLNNKKLWSCPVHRERMSRLMTERRNTDQWKALHGELTTAERLLVIDQIKRGDKYMDIALDWLISEDSVQRIASKEGLYRRTDKVRASASSPDFSEP